MDTPLPNLIRSTAGAVPVRNKKGKVMCHLPNACISPPNAGELTMQKVKVTRYISGRRPEYAQSDSESESSEDEEAFAPVGGAEEEELGEGLEEAELQTHEVSTSHAEDRRLQRLRDVQLSKTGGRYAIHI